MEMTGLSSSSLPSCLLSLHLLLLLQLSSSHAGQFRVIGPGHPIRALVGDEVELPCRISPGKNATGMEVGWYRPPFSRVVHLYRNGRDQDAEQAPEYRGRTELLKETIGEGKVTLKIRRVRFSDEGGFTCFFRDHSYQEEAAMELKVEDPFYWINPGMLVLIAVLPVLLLQVTVGLVFLCLQHRLRGKLHAEIDPHFLRVPCWKITLFVIVPVLGPLVALIICYNWLHRRLAGAVGGQHTGSPSSGAQTQPEMGTRGKFRSWDFILPLSLLGRTIHGVLQWKGKWGEPCCPQGGYRGRSSLSSTDFMFLFCFQGNFLKSYVSSLSCKL
uniref:Myelin oligodendrocyte glycoprotein n=1 Tax=Oryctolagus cuniculus TaxID=9986 RepID=A0A5F9DT62_RABIT